MAVTEIGFVQDIGDVGDPVVITVPAGGVAVGDLIVVAAFIPSETNTATVTDTGGNTYTVDIDRVQTGDANRLYLFRTRATTALASGDTISIEPSSFMFVGAVAAKATGIAASPLDKTASADTAFGTAKSSGLTATTTQADEVLIGAVSHGSSTSWTPGSGWTLIRDNQYTSASRAVALQYKIVSATGTYEADGSTSAADDGAVGIATYKAAASGTTYTKTGLAVVGP